MKPADRLGIQLGRIEDTPRLTTRELGPRVVARNQPVDDVLVRVRHQVDVLAVEGCPGESGGPSVQRGRVERGPGAPRGRRLGVVPRDDAVVVSIIALIRDEVEVLAIEGRPRKPCGMSDSPCRCRRSSTESASVKVARVS